MDFLIGNKDYPLDGEWYEYNPRATVDDSDTWEGAIPFKYKDITRRTQSQQNVQGIRKGVKTVVIETRERLNFKERDKVVLDRGEFKVTSVDFLPDKNYSAKHFFKEMNLHKAVITLE
jgi:hypothetical protein